MYTFIVLWILRVGRETCPEYTIFLYLFSVQLDIISKYYLRQFVWAIKKLKAAPQKMVTKMISTTLFCFRAIADDDDWSQTGNNVSYSVRKCIHAYWLIIFPTRISRLIRQEDSVNIRTVHQQMEIDHEILTRTEITCNVTTHENDSHE